jgi:hypothetical protein
MKPGNRVFTERLGGVSELSYINFILEWQNFRALLLLQLLKRERGIPGFRSPSELDAEICAAGWGLLRHPGSLRYDGQANE